ncbi:MAG TPA: FAD-dependent monooxygenase [Chitinophagaceae bacterium]|nr:FAD-dependent monooxygenase [Chitinophagaceae bacterium]
MVHSFTIIGGGIAGLTTAIALKRIGIDAMVIEATPEFRPVGAGLSLAANAMQAFREIGIADAVIAAGKNMAALTIFDQKGRVINRTNTERVNAKYGISNFSIHRAALHNVLYSYLSPERVIKGKRSCGIEQLNEGWRVFFEDGSNIESTFLIVAEGIHSPIRKIVAPASKLRYAGYTCWRGIVQNERQIVSFSETWGTKGRFGIVPLADNQIYWFATKSVKEPASALKDFGKADLANNFRGYHEPVVDLISATPDQHIIWNDIFDLEPINRYAYGNLVLVGDAAHATTPNLGQGACMAIEDAVVLANCLKKNSKVPEAFERFQAKRLKRTHDIVNGSWQMGKIAQVEDPLVSNIRNAFFRLIPQFVYEKQIDDLFNVNFD